MAVSDCSSVDYYLIIDEHNHQYGPYGQTLKKGLNIANDYTEPDKNFNKYGTGGFYVQDARNILDYLVHARYLCVATLPLGTMEDFRMSKLPDGRIRINILEITEIHDLHKVETYTFLKKIGANFRCKQDYPLKWALSKGLVDVGKFLLDDGAELSTTKTTSQTAAQKGYLGIMQLIRSKESGYDDNLDMEAALIGGQLPVVLYLESRGAQVANVNESLVWACCNGHTDIASHLLTKKHDINFRSGEPLKIAARYGHLDVVKLLISKGADPTLDNEVALRQAKLQGHKHVITVLTRM